MRPTIQRLELPPKPSSARQARRFVQHVLERFGAGAVADVGVLLTSELVTNAILHGHGGATLSVTPSGERCVRISVGDASEGRPVPRDATLDDTSGRGLRLVEILATSWGVEPATPEIGKRVWFELRF